MMQQKLIFNIPHRMAIPGQILSTIILLLTSSKTLSQSSTTSPPPLIDPEILKLLSLYITPSGPGVSAACENASQIYIDTLNDVSIDKSKSSFFYIYYIDR